MIGSIDQEANAQKFCDYLLTQQIDAHAEEIDGGAWQIWVEHDDDVDPAITELKRFAINPNAPLYDGSTKAQKMRAEQEKAARKRREDFHDVRTKWAVPSAGAVPITLALIVICVLVGLATQFGSNEQSKLYHALMFDYNDVLWNNPDTLEKVPGMFDSVARGEVWRLVTPMLLHFGLLHLFFNMSWMWRLGQVIEARKGSIRFLLLVLIIAILSNVGQALTGYGNFGGMSGVVAGLFGYAWMKHKLQPYEQIHVTDYEVGLMLAWLVICSLGLVGNIANAAHWVGLVAGIGIGAGPWAMKRMRG